MLKTILQLIAFVSLLVLVVPSFLYLNDRIELIQVHWIMLLATLVWFITITWASFCKKESL